ncbi:MAG: T9SS type A sorting domain-containing protein [Bacteroidota bacterium]
MKKSYLLSLLIILIGTSLLNAQTTLTLWNFDSSVTTPTTGTGTLSLIGGITPSATAFPVGNPASGKSYSTTTYPGDTAASGTAGYQFAVSTVGYSGISVSFDVSGTNQSSAWQQYEYTTNGTTWTSLGNNGSSLLTVAFGSKSFTLPASCDNNANLAFRIVSIFAQPTNTAYASVNGGGYNGNNGRWQIDNVRFAYSSLGVKENTIAGLKVYPNPAKSVLNITSDSFASKNVKIFNTLGNLVASVDVDNSELNVANLTKGIYLLQIVEQGKISTSKLVIE